MTVSEYVATNFTEEQQNVFSFLIASFPEKLRATVTETDMIENNQVTVVLAMMAHVIGNAREQIYNLQNLRDVSYLKKSIEEEHDLKQSDSIALLLNALDMGALILDEKASVEQNLKTLDENKEHFLEAYKYIENRGTLNTLNKVIRNFLLSKLPDPIQMDGKVLDVNNSLAVDYAITDIAGGKLVELNQTIEGMIDPTKQYLTSEYYEIDQGSDLAKMISMIRPAGIIYTIVMLYKLDMFENLDLPTVGAVHADNTPLVISYMGVSMSAPILSSEAAGPCGGPDAYSTYSVTITNSNPEAGVMVYLIDRPSNDFVANTYYIKTTKSHHQFFIGPNESISVSVQTMNKYK